LQDESFLALLVEDRIRTSRADKEFSPLNLPGPTGWWKKRNYRAWKELLP
jgi:hypothetical protein